MTRPIRNTGPCFPSGLPRQRGQRDVLSHTEFYTPIFCMLSVFQAIPFELPRTTPTVNRWDSTLCTSGWGQVLQSISSPMWSVPQRPRQGGRVTPGSFFFRVLNYSFICLSNTSTPLLKLIPEWCLIKTYPVYNDFLICYCPSGHG